MERIRNNYYLLSDNKLNNKYKIILLSDIHSNYKILENILSIIYTEKPDMILIAGDTLDFIDKRVYEPMLSILNKISNIAPTYINLGTHDLAMFKSRKILPKFIENKDLEFFSLLKRDTNCITMTNDNNSINYNKEIIINSINMSFNWYYKTKENKEEFSKLLTQKYNDDVFNILMSHSPNGFLKNNQLYNTEYIKNISLILSGHNHGGLTFQFVQDRCPSHIGIFGPCGKIIFPNAYGTYSKEDVSLIMSNGITKVADSAIIMPWLKIFNKVLIPDVETIELEPNDEHKLKLIKREIIKK